jgi:flagellar basal body-associated protein FliL
VQNDKKQEIETKEKGNTLIFILLVIFAIAGGYIGY